MISFAAGAAIRLLNVNYCSQSDFSLLLEMYLLLCCITVHVYPTANKPREKRRLAEEKRTAQKQQGPIHITEQKHRREGNRPESKHRVGRRV